MSRQLGAGELFLPSSTCGRILQKLSTPDEIQGGWQVARGEQHAGEDQLFTALAFGAAH